MEVVLEGLSQAPSLAFWSPSFRYYKLVSDVLHKRPANYCVFTSQLSVKLRRILSIDKIICSQFSALYFVWENKVIRKVHIDIQVPFFVVYLHILYWQPKELFGMFKHVET